MLCRTLIVLPVFCLLPFPFPFFHGCCYFRLPPFSGLFAVLSIKYGCDAGFVSLNSIFHPQLFCCTCFANLLFFQHLLHAFFLSKKHQRTSACILLRYLLERRCSVKLLFFNLSKISCDFIFNSFAHPHTNMVYTVFSVLSAMSGAVQIQRHCAVAGKRRTPSR